MNCSNCGTVNNADSKFCVACGNSLVNIQVDNEQSTQTSDTSSNEMLTQPINSTTIQNDNNFQTNVTTEKTTNTESVVKVSIMGYLYIMLAVILKPFTAFKEELNKFTAFKNSAFITLIVSGIATIVNLITTMLNEVMVKSYDWTSGSYKTTWTWENLKELDYMKIIGKNFLIYIGIIAVIATVYYIASLIVKKQTNFAKLLGISAMAVVPMLICSLLLSPILSLIWAELSMPITVIGAVYTVILIYEGMNNEVLVEGNVKYYFNLTCLSILGIAAYYLYIKLFMSTITSGLEDILDIFG